MKKLLAGAALSFVAGTAMAGHSAAGCGAGTLVFPEPEGVMEHVLAATTNGLSGNQTFGMTSGTLGCESAGGAKMAQAYMGENMEQLAADTARGQGESLDALASLMGVDAADKAEFYKELQTNFDQIFSAIDADSTAAFDAVVDVMSSNPALAKYLG